MAKGKYQDLFDLGEDALLLVERYIRQGMAKATLARTLQQQGQLKHLKPRALARMLQGYEEDVMDRALMKRIDGTGMLQAARTAAHLDLNKELMSVVAIQRGRVEQALEEQAKTGGLLLEKHGKEIDRYAAILDRTQRLHLEMGIIARPSKKTTISMLRDQHNPNRVSIEMTEDVIGAAERVAEMFEGEFTVLALPSPSEEAA